MYLPSQIFIGPLPLFNVLMVLSIALASFLLSRYQAPDRVQDIFWAILVGAILGDKGIYIVTDLHYYLEDPAHLIFTPESSLGLWGLGIGAVIGTVIVIFRHHSEWTRHDMDVMALAASPALTLWSLGFNWIGLPSKIPLLSIHKQHLDRFATFFFFFLLMGIITVIITIFHRRFSNTHGQVAGLFLLLTAISLVAAQLTAPRPEFTLSTLDWLAIISAVAGYRFMTPVAENHETN
ncbi:prolipoprotein diacylglyceryl transferase family protein [Sulfobacillus thermosulfidooxidans]|uniref:prolipoprotein diacylglyceryl transferase family protein n=1 Tax=Sulfobacillus thermosulfidooxidans TaxID=28034 RepID=UPI0006B40E04|nr:prolipoprotein diacylglyceryl transferase family protein [Sulfobacillus thermosulfidooxidans]